MFAAESVGRSWGVAVVGVRGGGGVPAGGSASVAFLACAFAVRARAAAWLALVAIARRSAGPSFAARASPPFRPKLTAAGSLVI